jgi:Meckel syndrome type 1 protein
MLEPAAAPQPRSAASAPTAAASHAETRNEAGFQSHLRAASETRPGDDQVAPKKAAPKLSENSDDDVAEAGVTTPGESGTAKAPATVQDSGALLSVAGMLTQPDAGANHPIILADAMLTAAASEMQAPPVGLAQPKIEAASALAASPTEMISQTGQNAAQVPAAPAIQAAPGSGQPSEQAALVAPQAGVASAAAATPAGDLPGAELPNTPSAEALTMPAAIMPEPDLQLDSPKIPTTLTAAMAPGEAAEMPTPQQHAIAVAQAAAAQQTPKAEAVRAPAKTPPATPTKDAAGPTNPMDAVSSLAKAIEKTEAEAELKAVMAASSDEHGVHLVGLEAAPKAAIAKVWAEARPEGLTMAPFALAQGDSLVPRADAVLSSTGARELPAPLPSRQLAPVLVSLALGRGDEALTVTLDPVELGRVEVSIGQGKEAGQVRIVAERAETLALLQRDQRELDRALNQAGLGDMARSLSFSLASDQGRQHHQQGAAHQGSSQFSGILRGPGTDHPIAPAPYPARSATSLLDIAV